MGHECGRAAPDGGLLLGTAWRLGDGRAGVQRSTQGGWQSGAVTLFMASSFGIPVSTTHTITGAIVGVGSAQRVRAVRWGLAGNIVSAWIVTMPAAAIMAALAYYLGHLIL